jgi:hypothetical protein
MALCGTQKLNCNERKTLNHKIVGKLKGKIIKVELPDLQVFSGEKQSGHS